MSHTPDCEPMGSMASSSDNQSENEPKEKDGPSAEKRRRIGETECTDKLEYRLGGILCCAVCLDLPRAAVYQCINGHLMCAPCFTHLLADARLRDEAATCPNCRTEISKSSASRNLAVEKAVSELPSDCKYCARVFPRHSLQHHEENTCEDRLTSCRYACIGCPWRGPQHEASVHETECVHPQKSAADIIEALDCRERTAQALSAVHVQILELLSYEKITFNDLQLKPYRTEEYVNKLYYETSRFSAFNLQWVVKAFVNKNQRDPTQSCEREITYQLVLKTKSTCILPLQYVALRGPYGEAALEARVYSHTFATPEEEPVDAPPQPLPLVDSADTNRILSNKAIHFRLIMFLSSK